MVYRYDSEEERVKERMESLQVRRQQQEQATRDGILLEEYRATLRSRRQYYWIDCDLSHVQPRCDDDTVLIQEHMDAWSAFEHMYTHLEKKTQEHILVYSDVPWIPKDVSKMRYLSYISNTCHESDMKKAYASVCLTWHPDKFQNKFKRFFIVDEWKRVVSTVNETFQEFRHAWEGMRE